MGKRYRGEVVYNQEDDVHAATLTVAQTLLHHLVVELFAGLARKELAGGLDLEGEEKSLGDGAEY
jgi:hypothetical protein